MKEREYIDVSNLARVRLIHDTFRQVLPMTKEDKDDGLIVMLALGRMERRMEKAVKVHP